MDREGLRAEYAACLRAAAERRFGTARAEELEQTIETAAGWLTEIASFALGAEELPAFYLEAEP